MSGLSTRTLERVRRVLERLPPDALALLAQAAIDRLDTLAGDPDAEADDDVEAEEDRGEYEPIFIPSPQQIHANLQTRGRQ